MTSMMESLTLTKIESLYNKVLEEYSEYKAELLKRPPIEIFDNSYRTVCYNDFLMILEDEDRWTDEEIDAMLAESNLLDSLYSEWLDCSEMSFEDMGYCADNYVDNLLKELESEENDAEFEGV
jgi:hypothetical protein